MRAFPLASAAVSLAVIFVLAGCSGAAPDEASRIDPWTNDPLATVPMDQPDEDIPPATAPPGTVMPDQIGAMAVSPAHWDSFGKARFGMDGEQVRMVWSGELNGEAAEGSSCYHLNPVGERGLAGFAMMFQDGPFVRYSVSNDDITAPGGGKRGMDIEQIEALYPERVEQSDHTYVQGGRILRIQEEGGAHVLVFETDAMDTVIEWRVGLPPQVDYVEGCD